MLMVAITWPPFTYTTFISFFFIQFNSKIYFFCHLMLKATNFSWLWISWVSFTCWFLVFLSCCYFFFFFYSYTTATTRTTTIISNSVSKGEGTPKKPMAVVTAGFCKPKLPITLTCLLNTRRASTHWITSKLIFLLFFFCALTSLLLYFSVQICQRNSISVNTWFFSFFQRSFLYFQFCRLSAQMIKGTSYKIRWRSKEIFF